ncbi:class I SAM-dependent methyltransferase, partial [Halorubrum tibetense]
MRRFSAEYLERTREGMWEGDRAALADLALSSRRRVLDVGCGTGEFTRVLREETDPEATVIGVDADTDLLGVAREQSAGSVAGEDSESVVGADSGPAAGVDGGSGPSDRSAGAAGSRASAAPPVYLAG